MMFFLVPQCTSSTVQGKAVTNLSLTKQAQWRFGRRHLFPSTEPSTLYVPKNRDWIIGKSQVGCDVPFPFCISILGACVISFHYLWEKKNRFKALSFGCWSTAPIYVNKGWAMLFGSEEWYLTVKYFTFLNRVIYCVHQHPEFIKDQVSSHYLRYTSKPFVFLR